MERKKQYATKQRDWLLHFFEGRKDECFSAKYLIENESFPMGEATVYRLLAKLSEEGRLRRFAAGDGEGATYQYNNTEHCDSHFHLKCLQCGETLCVDCHVIDEMEQHVALEHAFSVDNSKTVLYGFCKGCKK